MTARCVLVINGGQVVDETIERLKERLGAEVLIEHQARSGMQRAAEVLPDLILLDTSLSDQDGCRLCDQILETPELKRTPMVLIVSNREPPDLEKIKKSPLVVLVQAPISSIELVTICERVLGNPEKPSRHHQPAKTSEVDTINADPNEAGSRKVKFAMRGYLDMVSTGEVLQLLKHKAHSGLLRITAGSNRLDVFINKGDIAFARSHSKDAEFLLGRFLVEAGALQPEDLDNVLSQETDNQLLIGERLVQRGHITRRQLNQAIRNQTEALIYESLRWQEGEFLFFVTSQMPREVKEVALGLSVDKVLMEGFQRVYEWSMIEDEIKNLDTVLTPAPEIQNVRDQIEALSPPERSILALVDGYRSVREIIRISRRSSFDVCSTLFRLLSYNIIVKRPPLEMLP